jgi:hypothetical protein
MSEELDVEELQRELATIKDAMGLRERYPSQFQLWLVYGVLVGLASLGSQAVAVVGLPGWGHAVSWAGFMGLGNVYQYVALDDHTEDGQTGGAKPSIGLQYVVVLAYAVLVVWLLAPALDSLAAVRASATIFAVAVGAVGLAYLLAGNALRAYYIRRRDRLAFYAGGVWMLALAAAIPTVPALQRWGYAVFGIAFGLHAVVSYYVLDRE